MLKGRLASVVGALYRGFESHSPAFKNLNSSYSLNARHTRVEARLAIEGDPMLHRVIR